MLVGELIYAIVSRTRTAVFGHLQLAREIKKYLIFPLLTSKFFQKMFFIGRDIHNCFVTSDYKQSINLHDLPWVFYFFLYIFSESGKTIGLRNALE